MEEELGGIYFQFFLDLYLKVLFFLMFAQKQQNKDYGLAPQALKEHFSSAKKYVTVQNRLHTMVPRSLQKNALHINQILKVCDWILSSLPT